MRSCLSALSFMILILPTASVLMSGCSKANNDTPAIEQEIIAKSLFSPSITEFQVQAFYEVGAEPRVGQIGLTGNDTWDITKTSYEALFGQHTGRTVSTPAVLADMKVVPSQSITSWTTDQLVSLGDGLAPALVTGTVATVAIIFVTGKFEGSDAVLGVHIRGTRFAFVFKEVVDSVSTDETGKKYVEQATVVHEIGHTIGFVNNGVPMVSAHEDGDHPKHTTNSDGVMYWAVESTSGVLTFLTDIIIGGELNLFGQQTLSDGQAYQPE